MQDIDKLKQTIEDGLVMYQDISDALKSGDKITLLEGGALALKHGGKAIRVISSIKEISQEVADLDGEEAAELVELLTAEFGESDEAKAAFEDIAIGAGHLNQGIQKLIALKNS
jgi:ABC-type proline/glycine betaine transport system ATPase subunit